MFFNSKKKYLKGLIDRFSPFLEKRDIININEFLDNREYYLCFDTLITQLHEYDNEITEQDYEFITEYAEKLKIKKQDYDFIFELVRSKDKIPKPVKENISNVVGSLKKE